MAGYGLPEEAKELDGETVFGQVPLAAADGLGGVDVAVEPATAAAALHAVEPLDGGPLGQHVAFGQGHGQAPPATSAGHGFAPGHQDVVGPEGLSVQGVQGRGKGLGRLFHGRLGLGVHMQ